MKSKKDEHHSWRTTGIILLCLFLLTGAIFAIPKIYSSVIKGKQQQSAPASLDEFPVTVNPRQKTITEDPKIEALLASPASPLQAAIGQSGNAFLGLFQWIAATLGNTPWYQSLASMDGRFVFINPGLRKEQVAGVFGSVLGWNSKKQKALVTPAKGSSLPLAEGSFIPGAYIVEAGAAPETVQAIINKRFKDDILSHYSTSTAAVVPLGQALTIASLIQRETRTTDGMRLISGIIWNRLFAGMNLQIDSTLQYARANKTSTGAWWPEVQPKDKYLQSPYNTYLNAGLPPAPIASPSVAAVLAALNPLKTSCMYYFNDPAGAFHCSDTYAEHKALLQKYY